MFAEAHEESDDGLLRLRSSAFGCAICSLGFFSSSRLHPWISTNLFNKVICSIESTICNQRTFFPGLPCTSPATFSPLPTILSTTFSVLVRGFFTVLTLGPDLDVLVVEVVVVVVVVLGFATRPVDTFFVRGFEVLAFVVFLGATTFSIA